MNAFDVHIGFSHWQRYPPTGFPMPFLGVPRPYYCSDLAAFCSLGRSEHASERPESLTEQNLSVRVSNPGKRPQ
jgi:hypothetical protein